MIKSFRHKGLRDLFETGQSARVTPHTQARCLRILDALDAASKPEDMNIPGYRFHSLRGKPALYSVRVTGNRRITFAWDEDGPTLVNLEDYH